LLGSQNGTKDSGRNARGNPQKKEKKRRNTAKGKKKEKNGKKGRLDKRLIRVVKPEDAWVVYYSNGEESLFTEEKRRKKVTGENSARSAGRNQRKRPKSE